VIGARELARERRRLGIQLETRELRAVLAALRPPANLLVFGAGRDSAFWAARNPGGRTAFVEDDPAWIPPGLEVHRVDYATRRDDWRVLLDAGDRLMLALPAAITGTPWDMVIVDGPAGWRAASPGRMRSLYTASRLVRPGGDVFVHDAERDVERAYLRRYFRDLSLLDEVAGRAALRHYRADGGGWSARSLWIHASCRVGRVGLWVRGLVPGLK
jgi:glucuronoxylan 4-O-methyltransferase